MESNGTYKFFSSFLFTLEFLFCLLFINELNSKFIPAVISFTNSEFFEKIFIAVLAWLLAIFTQKIFRKIDARKQKIKEIHQFNEAVIYLCFLIESTLTNVDNNILKSSDVEQGFLSKLLNDLKKGNSDIPFFSFLGIPNLEKIKDKNFLEKIPNIGKYADIGQAFYRTKGQLRHFCDVNEDRYPLIKEYIKHSMVPTTHQILIDRLKEIIQRTSLLIDCIDGILDGYTYMGKKLQEIAIEIKKELKQLKLENVSVFSFEETEHQRNLRYELIRKVESNPNSRGRLRHMNEYESLEDILRTN